MNVKRLWCVIGYNIKFDQVTGRLNFEMEETYYCLSIVLRINNIFTCFVTNVKLRITEISNRTREEKEEPYRDDISCIENTQVPFITFRLRSP